MQIQISNLNKTYKGDVRALRDVSLDIRSGMFGLVGPNGAGKTTLMRILATLETPTSGTVTLNGLDIMTHRREIRESLGYLPQFFGVYPQLTGAEFLTYIAKLNGRSIGKVRDRVFKTLKDVGLFESRDRKAKTYSGGMLRRLGIAQALINDPPILIIDEPTVGLDPEERIRFRNLLTEISQNKIIILSTHIVADISSTCNDLALLSRGRLRYRGLPKDLISQAENLVWQIECDESDFRTISSKMQIISSVQKDRHLLLRAIGDPPPGFTMKPMAPNLEDAYMHFMEQEAGEDLEEEIKAQA